ncbi:type I polyketide synthase [Gloeocapsa sp. PCC 73106]|uniref:type I polyketide synthase n=1 Tax=Gloeocapsa sp. PCC 73106 TaxID=102232 RepID=UPI0002AC8AA8|nr:type I polyketide synthase [Gloeocapsa sp. PCC 73106]ELR97617.1 polyketide synthase family protein [Gloeocapsa sp. PCC 73106]
MSEMSLEQSERILNALREAKTKLEAAEQDRNEPIAIIGMAGRFPGARNIEQYWQNLCQGIMGIQFIEADENSQHPNYVNVYASFEDVEYFDAAFFGYSPREAEIIDPQHRVFLECAWEALENAGYDSEQYSGSIGVYAGAALNSYLINLYSQADLREGLDNVQTVVGNVMGLMPTRVSYKLNLTGPSCGIQTGCSTSLVAVHIACQSLLNRECDLALAGGITISSLGKSGYFFEKDGIASPDGYCRAFDADAQGTVFGNGVGIVVLKRLSAALADGDTIYAVIKGSAINNDGSQKVGLTAPSVTGQAAVIESALKKAGVAPETINYIEAHGTGTALGDPIEIAALNQVFGKYTKQTEFCAIGSVKTNIGHLDAAAGISGFIKTVLSLKHRQIPPSLNFTRPNPKIDFNHSPFYVNTQLQDWAKNTTPRRAGVSSFGMGGTNAHVILEEAPEQISHLKEGNYYLFLLSAKTQTALDTATTNLVEYLQQHPEINLADVAYTLQVGRRTFDYRRLVVSQNIEALMSYTSITSFQPPTPKAVAFMFSGQGSQYLNMGRDLYENLPIFKKYVDRCCEGLKAYLGCDLRDIVYPSTQDQELKIAQTAYAQPALFVIEYALAQLWLSWGIQPTAMIGHSIGEYVAACLGGVFSLEDALKIVAIRGKLMQQCPSGAMLSVYLSSEKVESYLGEDLVIAASNAPELCVISGAIASIAQLENQLIEENIPCRRLYTSHAFHSPMMEPVLTEFTQQLQQIQLNAPQIPFISNVTGTWITDAEATNPHYWAKHLRYTVRFAEGIAELMQSNPILLEIGPGDTLSKLVQQVPSPQKTFSDAALLLNSVEERWQSGAVTAISSLPHPQKAVSDVAFILNSLGKLWLSGVEVDWKGFYSDQKRQRVPLPTYPFERQRYWVEVKPLDKPKKKAELKDYFYFPTWERSNTLNYQPKQRSWLIFDNLEELERENQTVIVAKSGENFARISAKDYTINPENSQDYKELLETLQELGKIPEAIAWQLNDRFSFNSLLYLVQAIHSTGITQPIQLIVITRGFYEVIGTENPNPDQATILGLCKVIPQEFPQITCRQIDIETNTDLLMELNQESEAVVAYRGGYRWLQTYQPLSLPQPQNLPLREGGNYLIAGELVEGLGLIYAQYLAQAIAPCAPPLVIAAAKLIFIAPLDFPEKAQWETWLATHRQQDEISNCIHKLQAIEASGTEIDLFRADLADEAQISEIIAKLGEIHGVIHGDKMGDRSSCLIADLTPEKCHYLWRSKIQGLQVLEKTLRSKNPDFYLLQSSLSSVVGGVGLAAYAAGNTFMDALAHQKHKKGSTPWFSVNWDAVRAETSPLVTGFDLVDFALTPDEVWEVTQRIIAWSSNSQIAISATDLPSRISKQPTQEHTRPVLQTPYVAPSNEVEQKVAEALQELLGIEKVGIHDDFFELGGHSLLAIQAMSRLREIFQIELPMREFPFESPTVAGIASTIIRLEEEAIAQLLEQVENLQEDENGF